MLRMISRILMLAGDSKPMIILGIVLNIIKSFFMAMMVFPIYVVFNNLETLSSSVILEALIILIASIAGRFLFQWLMDISMSAKGYEIFRDYRLTIGERLKNAPMGYFSEQKLGTIQTILTSTVVELEQYSMLAIIQITGGVSMAVIIIIMLALFSLPIAVLSITGLIIGLCVLQVVQKRAATHTILVQKSQENLVTQSLEYIRGIAVLRAFSQSESRQDAVYEAFEQRKQAAYDQEHAAAGVLKLYTLVFKITGCGLLFLSVTLYLQGAFPLSYCLLFMVSAFLIYSELEILGDGSYLAKKVNTELDRLEAVTNIPALDNTKKDLNPENFDIELQNVSFSYDRRTVINNVSLKVSEGTTCAIVGPSGSGKTTLCNLIAHFWDVQEGRVLIGGKDIKNYTADSLLKHITMVFQNVYLFNDTIENNIKFGNPDATHEQVMEAARRAQCHDFITALPEGYGTLIGEGGSTLSGGEKQRISIARAILKDAPIIILDEATSSVDPENEHALLSAMRELTYGKTLISIAHRLNTVRDTHQIIVIDKGVVVQQGTHKELVKQNGIYRNFLIIRSEAIGWKLV